MGIGSKFWVGNAVAIVKSISKNEVLFGYKGNNNEFTLSLSEAEQLAPA
jgi:hypothetical protein